MVIDRRPFSVYAEIFEPLKREHKFLFSICVHFRHPKKEDEFLV